VVPRNQSRLIREVPLSDRSASASFRSTGSVMAGDFLMEELYSFVREGWEQEDDITLVTLRRTTAASRSTSKNTHLPGPWVNKRRGTRRGRCSIC
jgi:hypothetical protein